MIGGGGRGWNFEMPSGRSRGGFLGLLCRRFRPTLAGHVSRLCGVLSKGLDHGEGGEQPSTPITEEFSISSWVLLLKNFFASW